MTGTEKTCGVVTPTIRSRVVWADDARTCAPDRGRVIQRRPVRCDLTAGRRHGDDGTRVDAQRSDPRRGRVLVVPLARADRSGATARHHRRDDSGDGHGLRGGDPGAPGPGKRHDRQRDGAQRMTALWFLVLLPAVVGAVLCVLPTVERLAGAVSVATAAGTFVLAVVVAMTQPATAAPFLAGAGFDMRVDGLSAIVLPTVAGVTLLVLIFAAGDIREARGRFHGLMLLFAAAALLTVVAGNLVTLLFAWEIMGGTSYALIGFWWRDGHRVASGTTAFLTTRAGDLGLYIAAGAALGGGGGLGLAELPDASGGWRDLAAAGLLAAGLGKAAQLPFSFWLSRAMDGPSPVSALLHSAAMVAMGGYLLLRVSPLLEATGWAAMATAWVGVLTAVALGAVAVAQRDIKQLLAASTAAQLGFVVLAAGLGAQSGGVAQLVGHASTKAALFLAAGAWLSALGTKQLAGLAGAARRWRLLGVSAGIAALGLAGIPPLALWATKDSVLTAALEKSVWLYIVGLAAAALSAVYAGKLLVTVWRAPGERTDARVDNDQEGARHVGPMESVPVAVLAVGAAVLGMLALPPLAGAVAEALGEAP